MDFTPAFVELIAQRRTDLRAELDAILPQACSIVLEIGSGHGHFLTRYAAEFPAKRCVGVDMRSERIARSLRKVAHGRLLNCHFVRAEALEFLYALPPAVKFEEIWVLFPDPWPKKRHHKNRLMQPDFLEALAARSLPEARLYFRTDFAPYFESVAAFLPSLMSWQLLPHAEWPLEHETVFQARADGYQSLVAVRTSHPAKPTGRVAPGLPPPISPTSSA